MDHFTFKVLEGGSFIITYQVVNIHAQCGAEFAEEEQTLEIKEGDDSFCQKHTVNLTA